MTITTEFIEREARGIRGRFAVDVWERWRAAPQEKQLKFITGYGVPADRAQRVADRIDEVLADEGI